MQKTAIEASAVYSKTAPDVLFVDEDGNPIEAGSENLLYFDENGHEIPEEIAQQLLETGKYFDSREYYQSMSCNESQVTFENASATTVKAPSSNYLHQEPKSNHHHQHRQASSDVAQAHAVALAEAQARIFAEAQLQLRRREEELAQIEADANRESSRLKELIDQTTFEQKQQELQKQIEYQLHLQQQQKKLEQDYSNSMSNTDVEKSQSLRRIPMPPPKKINDASDSSSFSHNKFNQNNYNALATTKSGNSIYSGGPSAHTQQVFDLAELITGNMTPNNDGRRDDEIIAQARSQSKYASTDDEEYEYESGQTNQNKTYAQQRQHQHNQSQSQSQHDESVDYRDQLHHQTQQYYSKTQSSQQLEQMLFAEHLQHQQRQQDIEQLELQRKQQEIIDQVLKIDQSRPNSGLYISGQSEGVGGGAESVLSGGGVNVNEYEAVQNALAHSATALAHANSSRNNSTTFGSNHNDETIITSASDTRTHSENTKPYKIGTLKLVGHLRGSDIIRDSSRIYELDLKELEKYYDADETLHEDDMTENNNQETKKASASATTMQDDPYGVDPYGTDLFKDEMIELDYGAIDAYTSALNAHLAAERNNEPAPTGLRYASHILTSNHAMFLENQMFLGDAYFRTGISREVSLLNTREKELNGALRNPSSNGTVSGGSVSKKNETGADTSTANVSQVHESGEKIAYEQEVYSRSNSFGSGIELQSQSGAYCVSTANLNPMTETGSKFSSSAAYIAAINAAATNENTLNYTNAFTSNLFSTANMTQPNLTQSHYRSPSSNYLSNQNLKSSSTNIGSKMQSMGVGASNSRNNYTLDSQSGYNHGYYTGGKSSNTNIHTSHSGIYTMSNLIAQYGQ